MKEQVDNRGFIEENANKLKKIFIAMAAVGLFIDEVVVGLGVGVSVLSAGIEAMAKNRRQKKEKIIFSAKP